MKTKLISLLIILSLSAPMAIFAEAKVGSVEPGIPSKTENKLSEAEAKRISSRIEEIRRMDKTNLTVSERRELRKELRDMKEKAKRDGRYIYISAGTIIIILLILLLI